MRDKAVRSQQQRAVLELELLFSVALAIRLCCTNSDHGHLPRGQWDEEMEQSFCRRLKLGEGRRQWPCAATFGLFGGFPGRRRQAWSRGRDDDRRRELTRRCCSKWEMRAGHEVNQYNSIHSRAGLEGEVSARSRTARSVAWQRRLARRANCSWAGENFEQTIARIVTGRWRSGALEPLSEFKRRRGNGWFHTILAGQQGEGCKKRDPCHDCSGNGRRTRA
jgi:hypothetical protein